VQRRVTIVDVARHAGVSTAAVSKVLRNAYGVSSAMQERVRGSMTELGYRPHAAARGMRGKTYTIGVLLDSIRNPFFADILDGVQDEIGATDYQVLVGAAGFGAAEQARLADAMVDRRMDGLILIAPAIPKVDVVRTAASTPTVVVGHHDRGAEFDTVVDDDAAGARLVVDHLADLGHRRIAHHSTPGTPASRWTGTPELVIRKAFSEAMQQHGLQEQAQVAITGYSEQAGYEAGMQLLRPRRRPTAIFSGADVAALGVLRAVHELGLRVPDDVSVVGYNNIAFAAQPEIHLTTVDQAGFAMGASAARLLLERIDGRTRSVMTSMSPRLVVRGSTSALR